MKQILITLFLLFSLLSNCQVALYSNNQLILEFNSTNQNKINKILEKNKRIKQVNDSLKLKSFEIIGNIEESRTFLFRFKDSINVESAVKLYYKLGLFRYVEPNYIGTGHGYSQTIPNEPLFYRQWSHLNDGTFSLSPSTVDADIDTDLAWDITQGNPNLIVAVLDSGLKLDHPEFSGRLVAGFDFVNNDTDPTDDHGHGTNVTGIALASGNNSIGYAGVNWFSKIMPLKILDSNNYGLYSWWASAIYYAVNNGAKVINLSAGGNSPSTLLLDAINYAYNNNVSVVVSTGNQNSTIQYPAKYENAIAVGSTNPNDVRSAPFFWNPNSGSNFGPELDFVAPGNYIYGLSHTSNTNFDSFWGGTSQAAPHVAGVISLMLSVNADLTVTQIRQILQETSEDMVGDIFDVSGWDPYYGYGRINAYNALSHNALSTTDYFSESKNLIVYPNPLDENSELNINGLSTDNFYKINLISIEGKSYYEEKFLKQINNVKIKLENLPSGIYFVKIYNLNTNNQIVKKIIKK
ncbi:MAG: S8 family serine peptidase [Lentimicrobium sp.]|nr:S8 family serine peptidase [Lentimicrobium sp.]